MQWGEGKSEHEGGEPGLPPSQPGRWGALSPPQEGPYCDWALGASSQPACEGPGRSPPGEAKPFLTGTPLLSPQSFAGATSSAHSFVNVLEPGEEMVYKPVRQLSRSSALTTKHFEVLSNGVQWSNKNGS